jgi:hypothetical protein
MMSNIGEAWAALGIGAHGLKLVGAPHQFHLLDGFAQ